MATMLRKRSHEFDEKEEKFKEGLENIDTMDICMIEAEENLQKAIEKFQDLVEWVLTGFPKPREPTRQPPPRKKLCLQVFPTLMGNDSGPGKDTDHKDMDYPLPVDIGKDELTGWASDA